MTTPSWRRVRVPVPDSAEGDYGYAYKGVIEEDGVPIWTCDHEPGHDSPVGARLCAQDERMRRNLEPMRAVVLHNVYHRADLLECGHVAERSHDLTVKATSRPRPAPKRRRCRKCGADAPTDIGWLTTVAQSSTGGHRDLPAVLWNRFSVRFVLRPGNRVRVIAWGWKVPQWACGYDGTVTDGGLAHVHVRLDPNDFDQDGREVSGDPDCFRWLRTYPEANA